MRDPGMIVNGYKQVVTLLLDIRCKQDSVRQGAGRKGGNAAWRNPVLQIVPLFGEAFLIQGRLRRSILSSDKKLENLFKLFIAAAAAQRSYETTYAKPTALVRHLGFAKALT